MTQQRPDYAALPDGVGWKFERAAAIDGAVGGNAAEFALDSTLEGFVREVYQNLNDEGPVGDGPVEGVVHIREFEGEELERIKTALGWDTESTDGEDLGTHLDLAGDRDDVLASFCEHVQEEDRLLVVTVEDRNTRGLLGAEGDDGNFSALVLDELNTEKDDDSGSGGSWGLGKAVYPAWSGISTVLYGSTLSQPVPRDDNPRVIGRAYLPTHGDGRDVSYKFAGDGYFGSLESDASDPVVSADDDTLYKWGDGSGRPQSIWGDDAETVLSALALPRATDTSGTSVSVLGFSRPGETTQPGAEELGDEVASAISKWFWPAIATGQLQATVETPDRTIDVEPDHHDAVGPFVDCFERRAEATETLGSPGDVGLERRTIELPDQVDGTSTPTGEVDLFARLADPSAEGSRADLRDRVALVRGAGMVVKYYDQSNVVYGDRHFHGLLLAGRARAWGAGEPSAADEAVDDFLKASEPPAHDDWRTSRSTKNLRAGYERGALQRVKDLKSEITDAVKTLVGQSSSEGEHVAAELAKRLGLGRGRAPPDGGRAIEGGTSLTARENGRWLVEGSVTPVPEDHQDWVVFVQVVRLTKDGGTHDTLEIADLDCPTSGVTVTEDGDGYRLTADEDVNILHFEGFTAVDQNQGETRLEVSGEVHVRGDD